MEGKGGIVENNKSNAGAKPFTGNLYEGLYEPSNFTFSTRLTYTKNKKERETTNNYNLILSNTVWQYLCIHTAYQSIEKKTIIFKIQNVST